MPSLEDIQTYLDQFHILFSLVQPTDAGAGLKHLSPAARAEIVAHNRRARLNPNLSVLSAHDMEDGVDANTDVGRVARRIARRESKRAEAAREAKRGRHAASRKAKRVETADDKPVVTRKAAAPVRAATRDTNAAEFNISFGNEVVGPKRVRKSIAATTHATRARLAAETGSDAAAAAAAATKRTEVALARASGTKVMDDLKRLKKAERTRAQQKRKAARRVAERARAEKRAAAKKQAKRAENIAKRRQTSVDRMMKKRGLK